MDKTFEYRTDLKGCFCRIVADEGHRVKNPRTIIAYIVRELEAEFYWVLTATPWLNRVGDFRGYLALLFRDEMRLEDEDKPENPLNLFTNSKVVPQATESYRPYQDYD